MKWPQNAKEIPHLRFLKTLWAPHVVQLSVNFWYLGLLVLGANLVLGSMLVGNHWSKVAPKLENSLLIFFSLALASQPFWCTIFFTSHCTKLSQESTMITHTVTITDAIPAWFCNGVFFQMDRNILLNIVQKSVTAVFFFFITFCKIATDVTKRCKDESFLYRSVQALMLCPFPDCWHVYYKVSSKYQLFPDFGARPCFARIGESKSPPRRPEVSAKAHLTDQRSKWNLVFSSKIVWRASLCLW